MNFYTLSVLCLLFTFETYASSKVKRIVVEKDQIVIVKTALGVATIIQVPDRPNSLVVGDTEAFKVEYLEQAITIKPLHFGAKSNLYIYTDFNRFNVQLVSGAESSADYVVYLDNPKEKIVKLKPSIHWRKYQSSIKSDFLTLNINRLGHTKDGILIAEFSIRSSKHEQIDPKWFWLTQENKTKPIHRLIFSNLETGPKKSVNGMIQILEADVERKVPIKLELRRKKNYYLNLPESDQWK